MSYSLSFPSCLYFMYACSTTWLHISVYCIQGLADNYNYYESFNFESVIPNMLSFKLFGYRTIKEQLVISLFNHIDLKFNLTIMNLNQVDLYWGKCKIYLAMFKKAKASNVLKNLLIVSISGLKRTSLLLV